MSFFLCNSCKRHYNKKAAAAASKNHKLLVSRNTLPSCQIVTRLIRVSRIIKRIMTKVSRVL